MNQLPDAVRILKRSGMGLFGGDACKHFAH
jgi:hypothetical protein